MTTISFDAPDKPMNMNDRPHWARKAEQTRNWRRRAMLAGKDSNLRDIGPTVVQLTLSVNSNTKRDPSNWYPTVKAVVDGLRDAGLWPDDDSRFVATLEPVLIKRPGRRVDVALTPMTDAGGSGMSARDDMRKAVVEAMQTSWDEFVADTGCHPDCFWREGRLTYADFSRGNFATWVADRLLAAEPQVPETGERVSNRHRLEIALDAADELAPPETAEGRTEAGGIVPPGGVYYVDEEVGLISRPNPPIRFTGTATLRKPSPLPPPPPTKATGEVLGEIAEELRAHVTVFDAAAEATRDNRYKLAKRSECDGLLRAINLIREYQQ